MRWTPRRQRYAQVRRSRHPFTRPVDRLATRLNLLLAMVTALMIILSTGLTVLVYDAAQARATHQQTHTHLVAATITPTNDDAPSQAVDPGLRTEPTAVTWTWAGQPRTDIIDLPPRTSRTSPGTQTKILVDPAGNWAGPAITPAQVTGTTITALIGTLVAASALTIALHTWCSRTLDRHRQRYWDESLHRFFATYDR
ncbi:Rv1733c family protein [Rhodococcus koreensis]